MLAKHSVVQETNTAKRKGVVVRLGSWAGKRCALVRWDDGAPASWRAIDQLREVAQGTLFGDGVI